MAEPDSGVIQLKPFEESQCLTASPGTCTVTIKGYYRHSSILRMPKSRLTTSIHFHAPSLLLLSLRLHTIYLQFFLLHLSISVHVTPFCASIHRSFSVFHFYFIAAQSLFPFWCWSACLTPVCLCRDYTLGLYCVMMMMQQQMQTFFCKWHCLIVSFHLVLFHFISSFAAVLHDLHVSGWILQVAVGWWCISLCRKNKKREKPRWKQQNIRSIMVMKDQYCMETKCR